MLSIFTDIDPTNVCGFKCVNALTDSEAVSMSPSKLKNCCWSLGIHTYKACRTKHYDRCTL